MKSWSKAAILFPGVILLCWPTTVSAAKLKLQPNTPASIHYTTNGASPENITTSALPSSNQSQQSYSATQTEIEQARSKGLAWLYINQKGDGSWKTLGGLQTQPTAAALEALLNAGIIRGRTIATAQSWLSNADTQSIDSLSRKSIALYRSGADVASLMNHLTGLRHPGTKSWGAYSQYFGSFPDTSLAMDALYIANYAYSDTLTSLTFISSSQNVDGGWPFTSIRGQSGTSVSRVIPTAHNIATFSRYKTGWTTDSFITNGVNWLIARQKPDGGFAEDQSATVSHPYETALAYIALSEAKNANNAAAIAAKTVMDNALGFLVTQQLANGSWNSDPLTTALALQTLPATTLTDSDNDGIPDVVESILLTNPSGADGRSLNTGNGDGIIGINATVLLATIPVNHSFNMSLTVSGGTSPYSWNMVSGSLPAGLSLGSTTGVISGVPTATGRFNFYYKVSDTTGLSATTPSQINVSPLPVMVQLPAIGYFDTLQAAYTAQAIGGTVTIRTTDATLTEDLTFDQAITVNLNGGYDDIFTNQIGSTTFTGTLTISGGSVVIDSITIQ